MKGRTMKKTFVLLLAVLFVLMASGCAEWEESGMDDPFGVIASLQPPASAQEQDALLHSFALPYFKNQTLDPITCADGVHQTLSTLLYEGLFALDEQFCPRPALASSFLRDGAVYTVTLRSNACFCDGSSVTAADVAATLQRARTSARYSARLAPVESISASGDTVRIVLSSPLSGFEARLDIPIVKSGTEDRLVPLGSGRYCWAEEDGAPCLVPNTFHADAASVPFSRIALENCKDGDAAVYSFYSRQTQLLFYDLTATGSAFSGAGDCIDAPSSVMQFLAFNPRSTLFANAALRAALALGIDRDSCVNAYLLGHGMSACFPLSPASPLYPADLAPDYSGDDFAAAMKELGFCAGTPRNAVLLVNTENDFRVQMAKKIAADLSVYDLKLSVTALPWAEYQAALEDGRYDLYFGECRLSADWDLLPLLAPGGALGIGALADEALLSQINAFNTAAASDRAAAARALCETLRAQAPILPICFKSVSVLLPSGAVDGVIPTASDPFYNLPRWAVHWAKEE